MAEYYWNRTLVLHNNLNRSRLDRAINHPDGDDLDRDPFIDSLIDALIDPIDMSGAVPVRRSTGLVVGLTGEWGSGKSSILNLLADKLEGLEQVSVTTFNPWLFKGRDELVEAFFNALRRSLGKSGDERFREALKALDRYRSAIEKAGTKSALILDAHGFSGSASGAWKVINWMLGLFKPKPARTPDEERKGLETKIAATQSAIVVLIDELDPVEDDEVRAVAQLVKAVGDIEGISYLVAYDPARVAEALGRGVDATARRASGEAYLEKIVQMPIPIRPLFRDDVKRLLPNALARHGRTLPEPRNIAPFEYEELIYNQVLAAIRTPREAKRLAGSFAVLESIVRGEISVWDVLGYSWIASKNPSLRDRLAARMEAMVSDAGTEELLRRLSLRDGGERKMETIEDVLGQAAASHKELLHLLFPRFEKDGGSTSGNRLSRRRNLQRMLYLGNPPNLEPKAEIERFWNLSGESLQTRIAELRSGGKFRLVLERVHDLLPELPPHKDNGFWVGLAASLIRQHDWARTKSNVPTMVRDIGEILWLYRRLDSSYGELVRSIVEDLIAAGDLLITPWLLRKHMYAHGLSIHSSGRNQSSDYLFDKTETKSLLKREAPRYREALANGYVLRRLPDAEAMYVLANANLFDTSLKENLTEQLTSMEAIGSFAAVTVPPGFVSTKEAMEQIIDPDTVLEHIAALKAVEGLPEDEWLRSSIRRLEATLKGQDAHFHNGDGEDDD